MPTAMRDIFGSKRFKEPKMRIVRLPEGIHLYNPVTGEKEVTTRKRCCLELCADGQQRLIPGKEMQKYAFLDGTGVDEKALTIGKIYTVKEGNVKES